MPLTEHVINVINSELEYQDRQTENPSRPDMIAKLSAGDMIAAMEHCLHAARTAWYAGSVPHTVAAEHIRKVTALGARFLDEQCAPMRSNYTPKS